jgi:hypothetical protein
MNTYIKKCHSLMILIQAYREILLSGKESSEGAKIMHRKIIQLDAEIKEIDKSVPVNNSRSQFGNYKKDLKWL